MTNKKGFTLIELLIVIGIIAVLAGVVIVALNPARLFAQARNTTRTTDVNEILGAVGRRLADTRAAFAAAGAGGVAACDPGGDGTANNADDGIPATAAAENIGTGTPANFDLSACLVPVYTTAMPIDPGNTAVPANCPAAPAAANTGYRISQDANGRVTVSAPCAELGDVITATN